MDIGDRIRKIRGNHSRSEYAELLGIHPQTLYLYEKGKRVVDAELLRQLCREATVTVEWLIFGDRAGKDRQVGHRRLEKELAEKENLLAEREARISQLRNDLISAQAGALKAYELAVDAIQPPDPPQGLPEPAPPGINSGGTGFCIFLTLFPFYYIYIKCDGSGLDLTLFQFHFKVVRKE